jgi:outer membrane protein assembly factor BamB
VSQTIRHGAAGEFGPDQRWTVGGKYVLHFTARGNLELWNTKAKRLIWQSETVEAVKLAMQDDGNLVIYGKGDKPLWASHTDGNPGAFLAMQEDGNLVIYSRDFRPIWSTDTSGS